MIVHACQITVAVLDFLSIDTGYYRERPELEADHLLITSKDTGREKDSKYRAHLTYRAH